MTGAVEVTLASGDAGIPARSYTSVVGELTRALEEIDRVVDPGVGSRPLWSVTNTYWRDGVGATLTLTPEMRRRVARSTEDLERPGQELWNGVMSLSREPQIPKVFTASIVDRVVKVRNQVHAGGAGLQGVSVAPAGLSAQPASFDEALERNATAAVSTASLAYGSLVGRLDLISARGRSTRIGLRVENGPPVMCDVEQLDKHIYMEAFEQRVLVAGLLKRNASGQAIRLHVDTLELAPVTEPIAATHLLGALPDLAAGLSAVDYIRRRRGHQ